MSKKLIACALAVVAIGILAQPAMSEGAQIGETQSGFFSVLANGTKITGTNVVKAKLVNSSLGVIAECSNVVMTGEIKNYGTAGVIEANIETATFSGEGPEANGMKECVGEAALGSLTPTTNGGLVDGETVTNGTPWCLKTVASTDRFTVRGGSCSQEARSITFTLDTTLAGKCLYSRSSAIEGTFTTDTGGQDAVLTVGSFSSQFTREAGSGFFCPSTAALEMSITLETDSTSFPTPLYIK